TIVGLNSILCVDPARDGETQFLIGSGSYGGPPFDAEASSTTTCVADVGSAFDLTPAKGGDSIHLITDFSGSTDFEVDPGQYTIALVATGQTSPTFDVPFGGPTIVTVVRWVAEVGPRALLLIHAATCPIEAKDPVAQCYEN